MRLFAFALVPLFVAACGNTYHPEYHPVTVTSYEQHVTGAPGGPSVNAQAGPVFRAPPPPQPPTPAPWSAWPDE